MTEDPYDMFRTRFPKYKHLTGDEIENRAMLGDQDLRDSVFTWANELQERMARIRSHRDRLIAEGRNALRQLEDVRAQDLEHQKQLESDDDDIATPAAPTGGLLG